MQFLKRNPRRFLGAFSTLLVLNFIIYIEHFSIVYVNSSFLGQFFTPENVSVVYAVSSAVVVFFFVLLPKLTKWVGAWRLFLITIPVLQLAVFFLGFTKEPSLAIFFFTIQSSLIFVLRYILDVYVETLSKDESRTGNTRSLFTTAGNLGVFFGPLVASVIIVGTSFSPLYAFAALSLAPAFFIALSYLRKITPRLPTHVSFFKSVSEIFCCRINIRRVMAVYFLMSIFNAFIVIYAPLYLFEVGHISWQVIGSITALALLPYLVLEIPLGFMADRFWGEKEIMLSGLGVLGVMLILLSAIPLVLFISWGLVFIVTRVGGAMVEIATESYFFKQVTEQDVALISAYRVLWPIANFVTPLLALAVLPLIGLQNLFAFFGIIILLGIFPALTLVDTK